MCVYTVCKFIFYNTYLSLEQQRNHPCRHLVLSTFYQGSETVSYSQYLHSFLYIVCRRIRGCII